MQKNKKATDGLDFKEYQKIVSECLDLARRKNHDYGSQTLIAFKEKGIVVRLNDKFHRLVNLVWNEKDIKVSDEKIEDTAKDIINYSIYLIMMLRGNFLEKKK